MTQLTSTLAGCAKDIAGFAVMFNVVFLAYAQLGYLLFGSLLQDYSTITTTLYAFVKLKIHFCSFLIFLPFILALHYSE